MNSNEERFAEVLRKMDRLPTTGQFVALFGLAFFLVSLGVVAIFALVLP